MSLLVRSALTSLSPRRGLALSGHPSLVLQQLWPLYIYAELSFKLALYCELISDSSYFWPKWEPKPNQYNLQPPQSAFKRPPPCRSSSSNSRPGWASRTSRAGRPSSSYPLRTAARRPVMSQIRPAQNGARDLGTIIANLSATFSDLHVTLHAVLLIESFVARDTGTDHGWVFL